MLLALLIVGVMVVAAVFASGYELRDLTRIGQPRNVLEDNGRHIELPYAQGPSTRRLPEVPITTTGEYAFTVIDDTGPVRFDPCRTVRWVLAAHNMPAFAEPLVFAAVDEIELRTGLEFEYLGPTDEVPDFERPMFQERYGDYYAPLIIGWSSAAEYPDLAGPVAGIGGSNAIQGSHGEQRYLRGGVVLLDGPDLGVYLASSSGEAQVQAIIMHELAHVVGLAHVGDDSELMFDTNNRQTTWGPGDLQGLALAGAGPCE